MGKTPNEWFVSGDEDFLRKLFELIKSLGYKVIAPTKREGRIILDYVDSFDEVEVRYIRTLNTPKHFLFPNGDCLFSWVKVNSDINLKTHVFKEKWAFFGLHPCDANSLVILDKILLGDPKDDIYAQRRRNSLIIIYDCEESDEYCFCESVNARIPIDGSGDLWIIPYKGKYYINPLSDKGKDIVKALDLTPSEPPKIPSQTNKKFYNLSNIGALKYLYEHESWLKHSNKCLLCGACTASCPTCTCFDVLDFVDPSLITGRRIRTWNSCTFRSFTIVAGGRVIRKERVDRFKHRYYHKFVFIPEKYGIFGCTGCGRCVSQCHNRIHPLEVILDVITRGV